MLSETNPTENVENTTSLRRGYKTESSDRTRQTGTKTTDRQQVSGDRGEGGGDGGADSGREPHAAHRRGAAHATPTSLYEPTFLQQI